ncbi:DNA recombination protein RmuC, partial [Patescibacteria group bacterium]|nr:DNA recombination protein RmuC [Patescibacteria group bacterium]
MPYQYITIALLVALLAAVLYLISRLSNKGQIDLSQDQTLERLTQDISEMKGEMKSSLHNSLDFLQKQSGTSNQMIRDITDRLTKLDSTNQQVVGFASQLQSLEKILKNPKQRGILGEYMLESLLANTLIPEQYKMQYSIGKDSDGKDLIVDAAIFVKDKIIPIDAKFSLDNYNKVMEEEDAARREQLEKQLKIDLKNRIDETSKYIRPEHDTTEFAFMFIPAEGVFYNLLIYKVGTTSVSSRDLIEYAFSKRVIIVSPTSFFAYLQTVLQALKSLQVEENVKDIIKRVGDLHKHLATHDELMAKMGTQLGTVVSTYNRTYKELNKIDKDVIRITGNEK